MPTPVSQRGQKVHMVQNGCSFKCQTCTPTSKLDRSSLSFGGCRWCRWCRYFQKTFSPQNISGSTNLIQVDSLSVRLYQACAPYPDTGTRSTLMVQPLDPVKRGRDSFKRGSCRKCGRIESQNCHRIQSWTASHLALAVAEMAGLLKNFLKPLHL